MRKCPKCLSKYDDELNFCKACGTMLDTFVEQPPVTADNAPASPVTKEKSPASETTHPAPVSEVKPPAFRTRPSRQCPRCGSIKVILNAPLRNHPSDSSGKLSTYIDAEPDAMIFKDRLYSEIFADICGECGHVELRAENPGNLYNHHLRSKSKS